MAKWTPKPYWWCMQILRIQYNNNLMLIRNYLLRFRGVWELSGHIKLKYFRSQKATRSQKRLFTQHSQINAEPDDLCIVIFNSSHTVTGTKITDYRHTQVRFFYCHDNILPITLVMTLMIAEASFLSTQPLWDGPSSHYLSQIQCLHQRDCTPVDRLFQEF